MGIWDNTYLIYLDESADDTCYTFSTFIVPIDKWESTFIKINNIRNESQIKYNISKESELHATKFTLGKGSIRVSDHKKRMVAFQDIYKYYTTLIDCFSINGITRNKKNEDTLFEYLLNRINTFLTKKNSYGILICDERDD